MDCDICDVCDYVAGDLYKYRTKKLCYDCLIEYQSILEKDDYNPFYLAFKRGWESVEQENNYNPIPIPKWIEEDYKLLYQNALEEWRQTDVDQRFG